jgi:hypothetical protein
MRIADLGLRISDLGNALDCAVAPKSAIRNPQSEISFYVFFQSSLA